MSSAQLSRRRELMDLQSSINPNNRRKVKLYLISANKMNKIISMQFNRVEQITPNFETDRSSENFAQYFNLND